MNKPYVIKVDLKKVNSVDDIFASFQEIFQFSYYPRSWGSFFDSFRSLDTESSSLVNIFKANKWPKSIHLIIGGVDKASRNLPKEQYSNLLKALADATNQKNRYDDISFTFELADQETFAHQENNNWKPRKDYKGGGKWINKDNDLPEGNYKEYDVKAKISEQPRTGERFVREEKGEIYWTEDHYKTFKRIIE